MKKKKEIFVSFFFFSCLKKYCENCIKIESISKDNAHNFCLKRQSCKRCIDKNTSCEYHKSILVNR